MKSDYPHSHSQEEEEEDHEAQCRREYISCCPPATRQTSIFLRLNCTLRIEQKRKMKQDYHHIFQVNVLPLLSIHSVFPSGHDEYQEVTNRGILQQKSNSSK